MKRFFLYIICLISIIDSYAQGLNIGVVVPEEMTNGIDATVFKSLGTKLECLVTNQGAMSFNSGNIVLFPMVHFIKDEMIEGGMRNVYIVEFELTIKAVSLLKNITFGSMTWHINGHGLTKSEAVRDGLNKIPMNDYRFEIFFNEIRYKIESYYIDNKKGLIAQAKTLATQKQYEAAISLLYEYPFGISGYAEIQNTIDNIYKQYQIANCSQILLEARAKFATQDYETAAALIADIDATSSCASEAKALSNQIRQKINKEQAAERAQELEEKRIEASIEKNRIKAVSNMVSAYYKSRPRVTYNTIIYRTW